MTIDGASRITGASGVNSQKVEGSLDIFWENYLEPTASPNYRIHFLKYIDFRNGAQPRIQLLALPISRLISQK